MSLARPNDDPGVSSPDASAPESPPREPPEQPEQPEQPEASTPPEASASASDDGGTPPPGLASSPPALPSPAGPRYQPLTIVLAGVVAGVVIDRCHPLPLAAWMSAAMVGLMVFALVWWQRRVLAGSLLVVLTAGALGGAWHHGYWNLHGDDDLSRFAQNQKAPVCLEGVVAGSVRALPSLPFDPMRPLPSGPRTEFDVRVLQLRDADTWRPAGGLARVTVTDELHGIQCGDRIRLCGRFSLPPRPMNPGEFDYANFLRGSRIRTIVSTGYAGCCQRLSAGKLFSFNRWLAALRQHGQRTLRRYLDPQRSRLAAAILLGAREQIGPEEKADFFETGTVHLLVISGLHVGILCGTLWFVLSRLPIPRLATLLAVCAVAVSYMLLTEAKPPVVRATILVLLFAVGTYRGGRTLSFNTLAAAALLVVVLNPSDVFSTGAQLSFLSVAAMTWFAPWWVTIGRERNWARTLADRERSLLGRLTVVLARGARHMLLISMAVTLVSLPLVMHTFHLVAPVGLILNTILWIPITIALVAGFATMVLGSVSHVLGLLLGSAAGGMLEFIHTTVAQVRVVPGSHFHVPGPPLWWVLGLYGTALLLAAVPAVRPRARWCTALLAGWIVVGLAAPSLLRLPSAISALASPARSEAEAGTALGGERPLRCSFVSLGHGLSTLVELPDGRCLLYDAGCMGSPERSFRSIAAVLWSRGLTHLDAVVLSHGDLDHYNALPALLEHFSVGQIYISPTMYENRNRATDALREAIRRSDVPVTVAYAGDRLGRSDRFSITLLHPPKRGVVATSDNANSLVLSVECEGRRLLLTGDLEPPGLDDLMAERPLDCDLLLAPHHGGRRSNTPELAQWCRPEWVVVSGSAGRGSLSALRENYATLGSQVLHTGESGMITVTIGAGGMSVEPFLEQP